MIKENRDVRICDYLEALTEIECITPSEIKKEQDMRPRTYTLEQERFIFDHAESFTARDIAIALNLKIETVYNIGMRHKLTFKLAKPKKYVPPYIRSVREPAYIPDKAKAPIIRPKPTYDNLKTNYL